MGFGAYITLIQAYVAVWLSAFLYLNWPLLYMLIAVVGLAAAYVRIYEPKPSFYISTEVDHVKQAYVDGEIDEAELERRLESELSTE